MTSLLRQQVFASLRPYRGMFSFALAQVVLIGGAELLKPWPLKLIIDNVLGGQPLAWPPVSSWSRETLLLAACVALVGIYLVLGGLTLFSNYTTISIGHRMVNDLRRDLYSHLQRLSLAFHTRRQVGDLLYRVMSDTYAIQTLTMNGLFPVLNSLILLVGMFMVMIRLDWLLTFLALAVCPILFVVVTVSPLRAWLLAAATQMHQQKSIVYSLVQWAMPAVHVIQAFTKEEDEHRRFMAASERSLGADLRFYLLQTLYSGIVSVVIALGTALVVWVGARHVLSGTLTVGELIVFTSYLASLYGSIDTISQTYGSVQEAKVGVQRVFEILEVERDLKEGQQIFPPHGAKGEVSFEGISFQYLPGQPVLKQIDLHIRPGEKVAIVGPTGVGKSTLVSLLPRFYDPQAGRVLIDGVDVREFRLKELRCQIAMVLQPPLVFPLTIRENIAYGRPEASLEEVISAARLARIHDFIVQLPQGYDTVVGEQGATLSEGEKQRLTIARAILRNAPILILDEPTSSVDAETEALIMEGLERLMAGKTTLIIAHRLSTVRRADLIVVLRAGQIVEQGTFAELMRRGGFFAYLYRTQFGQEEKKRAVS
ncbi:MAG: ABC transporter ATP-binding protein [Deltaproteobacteria bacterium]|nr:ABC transporter ATP-binding protein [Deltaproteobacteria bacterium]